MEISQPKQYLVKPNEQFSQAIGALVRALATSVTMFGKRRHSRLSARVPQAIFGWCSVKASRSATPLFLAQVASATNAGEQNCSKLQRKHSFCVARVQVVVQRATTIAASATTLQTRRQKCKSATTCYKVEILKDHAICSKLQAVASRALRRHRTAGAAARPGPSPSNPRRGESSDLFSFERQARFVDVAIKPLYHALKDKPGTHLIGELVGCRPRRMMHT